MNKQFIDLWEIYGDSDTVLNNGNYSIATKRISEHERMMGIMGSCQDGFAWAYTTIKIDFPYKVLACKNGGYTVLMSDTPMERITNREFLANVHGNVLIAGLGLGLIIYPLLTDPDITGITVIDISQDVIDLITPFIQKHDERNIVKIVNADVHEYEPEEIFDTIYFDVWNEITTDNWKPAIELCRRYRKYMPKNKDERWISFWAKRVLKREKRKYSI